MTTLEDLYYGNISPHERYIKRGTRVDKLVKLICKNEDELTAGLTEKQKETFEKFKDCTSELSCITEREAFSSGFNSSSFLHISLTSLSTLVPRLIYLSCGLMLP